MSRIERTPAPSSGSLSKEQEEKIAGVPAGGTKGQVLTKKTNTSYDDEWATSAGGPPSGAAGGDLEGSEYPNPVIAGEKVTTAKIKLLAVTEGLLAGEAVSEPKIKAKAVSEEKLSTAVQETLKSSKAWSHTFAIAGTVAAEEYPGFFVPATEPSLLKAEYRLLSGTSCKFELLKNKEAIGEYTALEAKSTEAKSKTNTKALTAGWFISLKVTEVTAAKGLSVTVSGE